LTVSGTTTTINTETILLADNIITLNSNFTTGFGAVTTGGTADWNDVSNTYPGSGYTLLLGNATNGPNSAVGLTNYFHAFNFEYSSKDGTGNVTQLGIAYGTPGNELVMRGRYSGGWSTWVRFLTNSNSPYAYRMNQDVRTSDSTTFVNLTLTGQFNIPNNALISVNNEPDTWGARFRTTTSTTNLGAQLKNIIWTGGGTNEGFAVSGVGTGGAALEVRNDGIVWAKSSVYSNAAGNGGAFYLSDTAAGIYRDNTYDVTVIQNNSSGNILNLASAGDVRVSIDSNNNDTGVRFIVGNNAIKSTNELFSVNESGTAFASSDFRAPIFYDSDNTSYYTNPLSTSRYNALQVNKTYQNEQFIDVPGTFNGNRRWVRFSISRFNSGGSPVRLSISRAITDNSSNPYGGCTAEFVINSREWHSGQENMWYFYTEHGSYNANQNPYGYYIYQAGPRDLAGGGYWFYMLLLDGVRYRMMVLCMIMMIETIILTQIVHQELEELI